MVNETAARELDLYAENTSELYGQFQSIIANLKRKIASRRYDATKAPKLWAYWYEAAAKRYCREFGGVWSEMFPKSLRDHLARDRAKDEHKKIVNGEYGVVVKKSHKRRRNSRRYR